MRNRVVQIVLSLALLGLLIQIVLVAPTQIRDAETKAALLPDMSAANDTKQLAQDSNVDQSMKGMHMIETQDGGKAWELWSDKATSLQNKELLQLETVKTVFFSNSGVTFTVTGKRGFVTVKSKDLRVEGDVVTRSSNGYTFRTDVMEYKSATRTLSSPGHVEMLGPKDAQGHALHLTGLGMRASLQESTMEILSDVKTEKGLDKGRKAIITSHRALFSGKDRTAKFLDDVVLDLDNMRVTGPEARFDYNSKSDTVDSIFVSGGTRVSDADKWATAQNVNIDFKTNRFVFRGNPRVVQNNDELRGDEIVFLDNGKQVLVQKARAMVDERRVEKKK